MFLRERYQERHTNLDHISVYARAIRFHHPGYAHPNDKLLTLLAPDHPSDGLHHLTALTACGIVAGNRFDGYFSTAPNGQAIEDSPESVLKGRDYWFHVPQRQSSTDTTTNEVSLNPYPIYTSFEEWQFPHDSLPTSWLALPNAQPGVRQFTASSLTAATIYRDHTCRITDSVEATDVAHVIPVDQLDWFTRNSMERYACDPSEELSVNDLSNTILLRADLHRTFDALKWVIVPKRNSENVVQLVFHLIRYSPELAERYHNSCVHDIAGVAPQVLFAAFARAIFPSVCDFLTKGVGRWVLAISSQSQTYEPRYYSVLECKASFGATGRGRSNSPKKRKGPDQQDAKEACGSKGASSGDFIDFKCPQNPSFSEEHTSMNAIGDQDQCTCALSSGSDGPYSADKPLSSFPAYCRSTNCRYRIRKEYWRRLRLDGLEKERQKSGTQEWWKSQELWADRAFDHPLSPNDLKRFFWARGVEDATEMNIIPWEPESQY
ncbi:hypothetical protein MMC31_008198 [Peltigera leucophlebia]|nr:hypothetical protein [Peltigera leucophlebia]